MKMTDEQLLRSCVEEYANPDNYEPYEKDYGNGVSVDRMPAIARSKGEYAREIIAFIEARKVV